MNHFKPINRDEDLKYTYNCLRMMGSFNEYFKTGDMITNTNPMDTKRLHELKNHQQMCLVAYNEHNNYTLYYERILMHAQQSTNERI